MIAPVSPFGQREIARGQDRPAAQDHRAELLAAVDDAIPVLCAGIHVQIGTEDVVMLWQMPGQNGWAVDKAGPFPVPVDLLQGDDVGMGDFTGDPGQIISPVRSQSVLNIVAQADHDRASRTLRATSRWSWLM